MMEESLTNYIDTELKEMLPIFKWKIVKNSRKKLIELYVTFHIETDETDQVQDIIGKNNDPGLVQFEDVLCFYDPAYAHVKPSNYLVAISMNSHAGIEKGYIDALLRQLNLSTKQGMVDLREFLIDNTANEFSLKWNETNMNAMIQTMKETGRYSDEKLKMLLENDQSFFDKLKKDEGHDGVERV